MAVVVGNPGRGTSGQLRGQAPDGPILDLDVPADPSTINDAADLMGCVTAGTASRAFNYNATSTSNVFFVKVKGTWTAK